MRSSTLRCAGLAFNRTDFMQVADSELKALVLRTNVDGHLSVWGDYGVTIVRIHRAEPVLTNLRLGQVLPLLESARAEIIAHEDRSTTQKILKAELNRSDNPRPSSKPVEATTVKVRKEGFAWIDGQIVHSLRALAVPIFDLQGSLRAALSLVSNQASLVRFPNKTLDDILETGQRISRRLGG